MTELMHDFAFQKIPQLPLDDTTKVAYQGVPGAFAEQATIQFFGEDCNRIYVKSFRDVMLALKNEKVQYGVLPIENSSAGNVESNYDLLTEYDMTIVGEQIIQVNQALMACKGTAWEDIQTVYSHPQGLMQCSRKLEQTNWHQVSMLNTAVAAKKVQQDGDKSQAAIASARAAKLYDLTILDPVFNNIRNNVTRFIILSRKRQFVENAGKIGIQFGIPHESGALCKVLSYFDQYHLNMTMIESRPIPGKHWEYYFFLEFQGNLQEKAVQKALLGVERTSIELRILGNY